MGIHYKLNLPVNILYKFYRSSVETCNISTQQEYKNVLKKNGRAE